MERSSGSEAIDVAAVLAELDRIHAAGGGPERARAHLDEALARSEELGDEAGRLAILNELMGHLRSVGDHAQSVTRAEEALALADRMGLAGTDAYTTTLVNVATAQRAAGLLEQAHENYLRALADNNRRAEGLPVLVLDEDGEAAILLPLLREERDGLRVIAPARLLNGWPAPSLCRPRLDLTRQEARAILKALYDKLPSADLARISLCAPSGMSAGGEGTEEPPAQALSWRGLTYLLARGANDEG